MSGMLNVGYWLSTTPSNEKRGTLGTIILLLGMQRTETTPIGLDHHHGRVDLHCKTDSRELSQDRQTVFNS